ncbi:Fic family protein [Capnocytophaga catalasegens]|uniref:Fido domain-containing protein n=1 Tax=Capnocytophaga catalasegens TaxID=1004260 RepID=A0AAV5AQ23_9FLAO|nr:Fic family protein [Capnocytophaga catalasegens]GIZ15059.1 hypothetical protein RCZ03_10590 [Capnocytophaga catalasegens]GJM49439.1 hypothetical protein RCZ15_04140 [Capnocytophaga catalasegens]GJM52589.1 hypothetical protein RCZ16_09060 [Capnocytophaga catalasegens]
MKLNNLLKEIPALYKSFSEKNNTNISYYFRKIKKIEITKNTFNFYNAVSSIASSKIEGEQMEIDSFLRHKLNGVRYKKSLTEKPNDLYNAYIFAQENCLNKNNLLKAHKILSKNLLPKDLQGKIRKSDMIIQDISNGKVLYEACPKELVKQEFLEFCDFIETLVKKHLTYSEIFFYASLLHLIFVKIHPFDDGNGRTARLLEKWFLAEKLGQKAWFIQSELYYWEHKNTYYKNLSQVGFFYEKLDYYKGFPFFSTLIKILKS